MRQTGLVLSRRSSSRIEGEFALPLICDDLLAGLKGTESAGINRHIVGDVRALRKRRSDSILASSLACDLARGRSEA